MHQAQWAFCLKNSSAQRALHSCIFLSGGRPRTLRASGALHCWTNNDANQLCDAVLRCPDQRYRKTNRKQYLANCTYMHDSRRNLARRRTQPQEHAGLAKPETRRNRKVKPLRPGGAREGYGRGSKRVNQKPHRLNVYRKNVCHTLHCFRHDKNKICANVTRSL